MREQLEFKWNGRKACRRTSLGQRRRNRTRWWFEQMRHAVEQAPDQSEGVRRSGLRTEICPFGLLKKCAQFDNLRPAGFREKAEDDFII
jgi:hypothetical protein